MSNDAPVLEPAIIPPPRFPKRRIGRFAFIAASLGALGMAALGYVTLRAPQASAHVDVHISSPESPTTRPVVNVSRVTEPGRVQVALLLDTSGSMGGLIDQARSQLWKIVTRLDAARRDGKRPAIEIALYEYGNDARSKAENGWVRQIVPFTTDLDRISEALFALDTAGGEEYVGTAIAAAMTDLQWSTRASDLKLLFVAGNEPFDQGPLDPVKAAATAHEKGVQVTAILCGQGDPTWSIGAKQAHFGYFEIDHVGSPWPHRIAVTWTPFSCAVAAALTGSSGPWSNGSLPATNKSFKSLARVLHCKSFIAVAIAVPTYSSPPAVSRANSASEIRSRSVVNGRIWRTQPFSDLLRASLPYS
jgi:hypothetical protein